MCMDLLIFGFIDLFRWDWPWGIGDEGSGAGDCSEGVLQVCTIRQIGRQAITPSAASSDGAGRRRDSHDQGAQS